MGPTRSYAAARTRIRRVCETLADQRTLRLSLVEEVRSVVGFDAYAWLLTDPGTAVGCAPLADVPCLAELPRLIRLKYLTGLNRWTKPLEPPAVGLRAATGGDRSRSLLWRELLRGYDVGDVASVVLRDRFGCWGFLDLWRAGADAAFEPAELAFLADIAGPVTAALRRCLAGTFLPPASSGPAWPGPVVLLLSPDLEVRSQTPDTSQYLRLLVPPPEHRPPVPANAYNVGAQLLALEAGVDANPASARVHLADGVWVTARAARIGDPDAPAERDVAVTIQAASPSERLDVFGRVFGLTVRERELLGHLASGSDTRDLARLTFVSEYTVQDHMKSIFAKTATRSRRTLLARALGA